MPLLRKELKEAEDICTDLCNKIKDLEDAIMQNRKLLEELVKKNATTEDDLIAWQNKVSFEYLYVSK